MNDKKKTRKRFRDSTFDRDGHKCAMCKVANVKLDAHHITPRTQMPNGGYVKENGISLCEACHMKAEQFLQKELADKKFSPDNLYKMVGSSYTAAFEASENLRN